MCKRMFKSNRSVNVISQIDFFNSMIKVRKSYFIQGKQLTPKAHLKTRLNAFTIEVNPVIIIYII